MEDEDSEEYQAVCDPDKPLAWRNPSIFKHLVTVAKSGRTVVAKAGVKAWRIRESGEWGPCLKHRLCDTPELLPRHGLRFHRAFIEGKKLSASRNQWRKTATLEEVLMMKKLSTFVLSRPSPASAFRRSSRRAPPRRRAGEAAVTHSAKSIECSKEADAKGLHGKARKKFRSACKHGKTSAM